MADPFLTMMGSVRFASSTNPRRPMADQPTLIERLVERSVNDGYTDDADDARWWLNAIADALEEEPPWPLFQTVSDRLRSEANDG